jgi:hypothetical protein
MKSYLFGWNPLKWPWENMDDDIRKLAKNGTLTDHWSVVSHKTIQPGDRAYMIRLGVEPKGIFASGIISSNPYPAFKNGRTYYRIEITLEVLLNPVKEPILSMDILKTGNLVLQTWSPQASGISIKPALVDELEGVWHGFLSERHLF